MTTLRKPGRAVTGPGPNPVGEQLRAWRTQTGYSIRQLRDASGISAATIVAIEHGHHDARLAVLQSLYNALGLTVFVTVEDGT